jgi:hypothetical protein
LNQCLMVFKREQVKDMPFRNKLPIPLRYLKARMYFLTRPMFWGASFVLLLATLFIAEYWNHPERFRVGVSSSDGSSEEAAAQGSSEALPPPEDNAIGADIDSLPLLFSEIEGFGEDVNDENVLGFEDNPETFANQLLFAPESSADSEENPFRLRLPDYSDLLSSFNANGGESQSASTPNLFSPSGAQPPSVSGSGYLPGVGATMSNDSITSSPSGLDSNPVIASPLQSAINRYGTNGQTSPSAEAAASLQSENGAQTPGSAGLPSNSGLNNSAAVPPFSGQTTPGSLPYFQNSPIPGTTGYTVPPILNQPPASSAPGTQPSGLNYGNVPIPGQSQPGWQTPVPAQPGGILPSTPMPGGSLPQNGFNTPGYTPPPQFVPQPQSSEPAPTSATIRQSAPGVLPGTRRIRVSQ